jgi:fumarate reductase subunit C
MSPPKKQTAGGRRPYMRSMDGWWWRQDPFFVRYMIREATALIVAAYALVLLAGVWALAEGEATWNIWLAAMRNPVSIALHAGLLVGMIYHSYSWFDIMPKTMPVVFVRGKRVAATTITILGVAAAIAASAALFGFAWMLAP